MKLAQYINLTRVFYILLFMTLVSCMGKKQSENQTGDLTDLKDFPKEWVLADDIAPPDSISRNYIVAIDSSNSFLGNSIIKRNGDDWQMINSGFYYPGTYTIRNCKRTTEGEMVYFDFDLENIESPITVKLKVNFRHNLGQSDNVPSVFTCTTCDNVQDILMVEKTLADKFPQKNVGSLQYD